MPAVNKFVAGLGLGCLIGCEGTEPASPPVKAVATPEVLQLHVTASRTELRPSDDLVVRLYATNPTSRPAVARVEDVFTGIPPCKVPTLPPTLRIAPGATDSAGYGWAPFALGRAPGNYELQVVYRTLDGVFTGQTIALRFLAP